MTLIATDQLSPNRALPTLVNLQTYCGLDCELPLEIHPQLTSQLTPQTRQIYNFELALQGPYLDMMLHGFAVDQLARQQAASRLHTIKDLLETQLHQLAFAVWDRGLNPRSPKQLIDFFYHTMGLPEVWLSQKGERKLSTNREALEKLDNYLHARPFVSAILGIRGIGKQLEVLETQVDNDGRYRTSYNIAGTETGRPSSSSNAFGFGGNAQNIAPSLRYVFVADPGHKLGQVDLEQVEARDVGWFCGCLFNDWSYLDACESGDLHTANAKRIWPGLGWSGSPRGDRAIADRNFYREFSYRDMAKRGSHLSNYMGTAWTAARALKVPQGMMDDFQARYCRGAVANPKTGAAAIAPAYPCIPRWWAWIAEQLQRSHLLVTPFGRRRHFFGRPGDDATLREAIAFLPQSTTADRMNLGLWRVWKHQREVQVLGQGYDSIVFQFADRGAEYEGQIMSEALERIRVQLEHPSGRKYVVPGEAKVGWNWGEQVTQRDVDTARNAGALHLPRRNDDGLTKWSASHPDTRKREQQGFRRTMT